MGKTITKYRQYLSLIITIVMLFSMVPSTFANYDQRFSDFPTGWSRPAMEAAVDNGLLVGIGGGKIGPQKYLTRAEMAAVMVRAFGATTTSDISQFDDVDVNSWYYGSVASAVKMGALAGESDTKMAPSDYITREQVFSILSRVLALESANQDVLSKFSDGNEVSDWALTTVIPLVERGYVNGDNFGKLNPKSYITREEFAQLMYTTIRRYITTPGTYEENMEGIVVLRCGNVTLRNMTVTGDLVVGDGAAKEFVNLENVTVNGRLLTRGGSNQLRNTTVRDGVVVLNPNGVTPFRNYRTEAPFAGIIEYTVAAFLTPGSSGSPTISGGESRKYTVTFKVFESDVDEYEEIRVTSGNKIGNKMPADPTVPGYIFNGWVDEEGNPVTRDTRVYDDMLVVADLSLAPTPTTYYVTFKLFDTDTVAYATVGVLSGGTVGLNMPADPTVAGYTFNGWLDENGNPFDEDTAITGPITVIADLTLIPTPPPTYTVTFKLFDTDTVAYATVDVVSGDSVGLNMPADPTVAGYTFNGWLDENGNPFDEGTAITGPITVIAILTPDSTTNTIVVTFYEGYGQYAPVIGTPLEIDLDTNGEATVDVADIPDISIYSWLGYKKSDYMPSSYEDYVGEYHVAPEFFYLNNGTWEPFDETVVMTNSTDVHLFYKNVSLDAKLGTQPNVAISTRYDENSRLMESAKSLMHSAVRMLNTAKDNSYPFYENLTNEIVSLLESKDLVDADKNIKYVHVPLPINTALNEGLIKDVIEDRIDEIIMNPSLHEKIVLWPDAEEYLRSIVPGGASVNLDVLFGHIDALTTPEKKALVDEICQVVYDSDEYDKVTDCVLNNKPFKVNMNTLKLVKEIHQELEIITFDTVMNITTNESAKKVVDFIGDAGGEAIFNEGREEYCNRLEEMIYRVENGLSTEETIDSAFDLVFDPVEMLDNLYEKATDKAVTKLEAMDIYYDENPYLQYLVEGHDIIDELFIYTGNKTAEHTAYQLKSTTDYATYAMELMIALDDALTWYGTELTDEEFEEVYEIVFDKIYSVHDRIDDILIEYEATGELPEQIKSLLTKIQKLNNLYEKVEPQLKNALSKYLDSKLYEEIANGTLDENEKILKLVDILIGKDDPIYTIDSLFDVFYQYDDKMQEKLATLVESDKFDTAIDKLRASRLGQKLGDDAIDDIVEILENVAEHGVSYYLVDTSSDKTIIERYQITIGDNTFTLTRSFIF